MAVSRYTFVGTLRAEGALHIGSGGGGRVGFDDALTDATVARDNQGRPFVPGSSLRGVLRAAVGQLAPSLPGLGEIREDGVIDKEVWNGREKQNVSTEAPEADQQQLLRAVLTPAERLFGTVHWASPLLIPDLSLVANQAKDGGRGEIRHGVGIDRDTGAARDGVKYDFEVLPSETAFSFWMRCDIPNEADEQRIWPRLLAVTLRLLEQGELNLGGRAARGVGQVRLTDLKVYRLEMGGRSLIDALLAAPDSSDRYGAEQPGWVEQHLKELREGAA